MTDNRDQIQQEIIDLIAVIRDSQEKIAILARKRDQLGKTPQKNIPEYSTS